MALITIELDTDNELDRAILSAVNTATAYGLDGETDKIVPLETVATKKVKFNPPTPLMIVKKSASQELKEELKVIDEADPAKVFADPAPIATDDPPPPPPDTAVAVELDLDRLPWDKRIHSGAKSKLVSGQWKPLRKVSPDTVSIVTEELRNIMGATATTVAPPPPVVVDDGVPRDFGAFVQAMVRIKKTNADVDPILAEYNIAGLNLLGARPDLIPEIWARLNA